MAKTTAELIPRILEILGQSSGAMGIGEFLLRMRSEVMSHRLLIEALNQMAMNGQIAVDDTRISLGTGELAHL